MMKNDFILQQSKRNNKKTKKNFDQTSKYHRKIFCSFLVWKED